MLRRPCPHGELKKSSVLAELGNSIHSLRDFIRGSLFTRRAHSYTVMCRNRMQCIGPGRGNVSMEETREMAAPWGPDPVHPAQGAYMLIAEAIVADLSDTSVHYQHPPSPREAAGPAP